MSWTQLCASKHIWLTVTEYLCYTSPRRCPVLLSSSGEETDYHYEYPSSPRSPHAMALTQLTSIFFSKLKD